MHFDEVLGKTSRESDGELTVLVLVTLGDTIDISFRFLWALCLFTHPISGHVFALS
jgi:hypothetical protein